jgi:hypothetical protein
MEEILEVRVVYKDSEFIYGKIPQSKLGELRKFLESVAQPQIPDNAK